MPAFKTYKTRRLVIRPLRLSDHGRWCAALDEAGAKKSPFDIDYAKPSLRLKKNLVQAVRRQARQAKRDEAYIWNIFLRSNGKLIGWLDISTVEREPRQWACFGYFLMSNHRGQGYAREAVRRIVRAGFKDLGFHRLEAITDTDNQPSIALLKAAGFHDEGVRKHYWFQNGRWEDQRVFAAIPELFR